MSDQPFTPMEPVGGDTPSVSARDIAAAAAAEAVRGEVPQQPLQSPEAQYVQQGEPTTQQAPTQEQTPLHQEQSLNQQQELLPLLNEDQQSAANRAFASEAYNQLRQMGVDVPVSPDQVDPQFADAYERMARAMLDTTSQSIERMQAAQETQLQMKDFSERLGTPEGRERLLLALAMNAPDDFTKSMQVVERMQADPEYAEAIRMRLESEARMEAAQRMEQAYNQTRYATKGQQVESRTVRLAEAMGVNVELAKEAITGRILQNEAVNGVRDISLDEVDSVIQRLAAQTGAQPAVRQPQVHQQHAAQPPQQPVANQGTPSSHESPQRAAPRGSAQTPNTDALDALRSAVKGSMDRARRGGL
jgi:hypothetical protein